MILITITLGQLAAQVTASSCMLDFINNYFMLFSTYISLGIEFSGLLHCVYLVQIFFAKITGTSIISNENPRSSLRRIFFWLRVGLSLTVLSLSFAVTLSAMAQGKTTAWKSIPTGASIAIFFALMGFVGLMERMQISLFATMNLPEEDLAKHPAATKTCKLAFSGINLQALLIGRQILVTLCMFVVAKLSSLDVAIGTGENIFGVSDSVQAFFNTGLLGAIITTIVASLAWRIVASSFPFFGDGNLVRNSARCFCRYLFCPNVLCRSDGRHADCTLYQKMNLRKPKLQRPIVNLPFWAITLLLFSLAARSW